MLASNCNLLTLDWKQVISPVEHQGQSQTKVIVPLGVSTQQEVTLRELIQAGARLFLVQTKDQTSVQTQLECLKLASSNFKDVTICILLEVSVGTGSSTNADHVLQDMQGIEEATILGKRKAQGPRYLRQNDVKIIEFLSATWDVPYVVIQHCRNVRDIMHAKQDLETMGLRNTKIILKIDNWNLLEGNFRECVNAVDAVYIDREVLGSEWEKETEKIIKLPLIQKKIIKICNYAGKPVLIGGVVDTLSGCLRPTRAEATDIANNILDGVDGIVLGQQISHGHYPSNTFATVQSMCHQAERIFNNKLYAQSIDDYLHRSDFLQEVLNHTFYRTLKVSSLTPSVSLENIQTYNGTPNTNGNIASNNQSNGKLRGSFNFTTLCAACYAAVKASFGVNLDAIVLAGGDDRGCTQLAQFKPACPIIVLISKGLHNQGQQDEIRSELLATRSALYRGVEPLIVESNINFNVNFGIQKVQEIIQSRFGTKYTKILVITRDVQGKSYTIQLGGNYCMEIY